MYFFGFLVFAEESEHIESALLHIELSVIAGHVKQFLRYL